MMNTPIYSFFNQSRTSNIYTSGVSLRIDIPRFIAICASFLAVWCVYVAAGVATGVMSALLTGICTSPLFSYPAEDLESDALQSGDQGNERREVYSSETRAGRYDEIFETNDVDSVDDSADETQSRENNASNRERYGRIVYELLDHAAAICIDDIDELLYVGQVLRENQGILVLLIGGIASMMMAILAGLDDVNVFKAFYLSTCCYVITTLLVAKSARRAGHQQNDWLNGGTILNSDDINAIMKAVPREKFVREEELRECDTSCIEKMIRNRSKNCNITDNKGNKEQKKAEMLKELRRVRNYNESCCICLSTFERGKDIRVLPGCRHEFHDGCINQWAHTFARNDRRYYGHNRGKPGKPTCPLCKTCFGNVPSKNLALRY
mmetsp:Transcript_7403/g.15474  ORF Transcript_7403/g.15474 Transcript_7403/m.15474 type:complete len:380 (+) Transcript_7403:136-1275(+)